MKNLLLWLLAVGLVSCADPESVTPLEEASTAKTLGMFSSALSDDAVEQTRIALEQDAWRREQRFIDAVDPGYLLRSTRVSHSSIANGQWTPDEIFQLGAQLFHLSVERSQGFGAADLPALTRFHFAQRGGPDAYRCVSCHWRGGPAGAGDGADSAYLDGDGNHQSSALARNPVSLVGSGYVEIVAREMTAELQAQATAAHVSTSQSGKATVVALVANGVSFGELIALPDGSLDTSNVEGLDADLVIKPFGWKGNLHTVRDAVEDALLIHHGLQSSYLVQTGERSRIGRFAGEHPRDPDGDGVEDEISEGQVTALSLYIAMQELPQIELPVTPLFSTSVWAAGQAQFESLGCAGCHTPLMTIRDTTFRLPGRLGGEDVAIDLAADGAEPRIQPAADGTGYRVYLHSDLKRHDMGEELAESRPDRGVEGSMFLTRPLWGVARSRPYMHDGRAPTIPDALKLHGGEAAESREKFLALTEAERAPLRVYLASLTRARRVLSFQ